VFDAAVRAGLFPLAVIGIAASTIGAYYYLRVIKTMYFDEPTVAFGEGDKLEGGMIAIAAVMVSPLGYLAIPLLGGWSMAAARALFRTASI
jgi:NADH-quinone oxidoreductase subunit N